MGFCGLGALLDSYWQKSSPCCKAACCPPHFTDGICGPERSRIARVAQRVLASGPSSRLGTHVHTLVESKPSPEVAQPKEWVGGKVACEGGLQQFSAERAGVPSPSMTAGWAGRASWRSSQMGLELSKRRPVRTERESRNKGFKLRVPEQPPFFHLVFIHAEPLRTRSCI